METWIGIRNGRMKKKAANSVIQRTQKFLAESQKHQVSMEFAHMLTCTLSVEEMRVRVKDDAHSK